MIPRNFTRVHIGATLTGIALFFAAVSAVGAQAASVASTGRVYAGARASSGVSLRVAVGYQNIFRGSSWTPVRVTIRNNTGSNISGLLTIPVSDQSASVGASPSFHGLYQAPVSLPAGGTKHITMYVPGSGLQGRVDASFLHGGRVLATGSAYPIGVDSGTLLIGVLASNPSDFAWLAPAIQQRVTTHVIPLSVPALDPVAQALAAFDVIVLTNVDTSGLDAAQLSALEGYVHNGGSLLLVGGPAWQETLRPLPASLLPGKLAGMRVLPNLDGLLSLGTMPRAAVRRAAAVSVLANPGGTVWGSQAGVPLVVRTLDGQGAIEYLAFDPALTALPVGSPLLEHLVAMAAPLAITRTWSPQGFRARFEAVFRNASITGELGNVPPATLPFLAFFAGLTLLYVFFLGPANFLILRRLGRQYLAWITLPALAIAYLVSMSGIAAHLKDNNTLLNAIGVINLDGGSSVQQPESGSPAATMFLSLAAPLPGTYRLSTAWNRLSGSVNVLPAALPQESSPGGFSFRDASTLHSSPLGMLLQEGPRTTVTFLSLKRWATRDVTLDTSVHVPGTIQTNLQIDARGDIAGSIHNGTNLDLRNPVVLAGQAIARLPSVPAGATVHVRVRPSSDIIAQDPASIWNSLYGGVDQSSDGFGGFGFGDCCNQFSMPEESALIDRERNAISMLSQTQALGEPSGVLLVGWNERPLATFTVDGATPRQRDLNLVITPLGVHLPAHGPFRFMAGTLAARLVDIVPRAPLSSCCSGFGGQDATQQISVGIGGSLTFEFDLPPGQPVSSSGQPVSSSSRSVSSSSRPVSSFGRSVRFGQLVLSTGSGADSLGPGRVFDWQTHRWVNIDLSSGSVQLRNPNRFVSSRGRLLVELRATTNVGDLTISDQSHAIELSGSGVVR